MTKLFQVVKYLLVTCPNCKGKNAVPTITLEKRGNVACCGRCQAQLFGFMAQTTKQNTGNGETEMKFDSKESAASFFAQCEWCKACAFSRKPEGCAVWKLHSEHVGCSDESQVILDGLVDSSGKECSMFIDATQIEEAQERQKKLIALSVDVLYTIENDFSEDEMSAEMYEAVTRARLFLFPGESHDTEEP